MRRIKVCGINSVDNLKEILTLPVDYVGFIFYPKSPRFAGNLDLSEVIFPENISKVGVFVNENIDTILQYHAYYQLDYIQLHGEESPEFCEQLVGKGCQIIKAFNISSPDDLLKTSSYENNCQFFLFDTKTPLYGGSGQQFDWSILKNYTGKTPFFLSGGIGLNDINQLETFTHSLSHALDLNSKFELTPGIKDIQQLKKFIYLPHNEHNE